MKIIQILPAPDNLVAIYETISGKEKGHTDSASIVCLAVIEEMGSWTVVGLVCPADGSGKPGEFVPAAEAVDSDDKFIGYEFE